jgi:hypothetical protein
MSIFSQIKADKPTTNQFDLSHDRKMSMDLGTLTPILALECIPGDKFNMSTSQMLRFAPLVAPMMHQVTVYTHFFFVPNRILWSNWKDFITGGEDGLNTSVFPTLTYDGSPAVGTLSDYLGLPVGITAVPSQSVSALPFAAYQRIYNEYYRDQNLISKVTDTLTDGINGFGSFKDLRTRAWQHDYFTSALPWTQKGAEATIPLGAIQEVTFQDPADLFGTSGRDFRIVSTGTAGDPTADLEAYTGVAGTPAGTWQPAEMNVGATTINELRNAFRLQEWLEKNARGGSRYIECIKSHFGVTSSDSRLQRPEFLGGGSSPVTISEVLQTSSNATQPTPQGNMAGHGISVGSNNNFTYSCEEHGYIMGIMSILPKTAYQDGIPKHFLKFDKFDYFWPSFAHLGEQPIENKELYFTNDSLNEDVFGYTPRYAEYKYMNSSVHGEFKTTLKQWHMGRIFTSRPALNKTFIECTPTTRVFAVLTGEKIYAHVYHNIRATRKMPYFGTPNL